MRPMPCLLLASLTLLVLAPVRGLQHSCDDAFASQSKRQAETTVREDDEDPPPRKQLPDKVKQLLRILRKPKKSDELKLNGWSASGMPFNVLYTPNTLNQRFLFSLGSTAERRLAPETEPARVPAPEEVGTEYPPGSGLKAPNRLTHLRKHYLVIPQLFVSYGWGSLGK